MSNTINQLADIASMIEEARDAVADGELVDLTEIQGLVQDACLAIQANPPTDADTVHEVIGGIIEDLNRLAEELKAQQEKLGSAVVRRAARSAYKTRGEDN